MADSEKRYTFEIAPGVSATFNTKTPHPETLRILADVVKMAMAYKAPKERPSKHRNAKRTKSRKRRGN